MVIFGSDDYRDILRSELTRRTKQNPRYSQGAFARDLALSASRLSEILSGKQGISGPIARQIAKSLNFSEPEESYFLDLVESQHGRSRHARDCARARLRKFKMQATELPRAGEKGSGDREWYALVILGLLRLTGAGKTVRWFVETLGLSRDELMASISYLQQLGLVTLSAAGAVEAQAEVYIHTPSTLQREFQLGENQLLWRTLEALEQNQPHLSSAALVSVSSDALKQLPTLVEGSLLKLAQDLEEREGERTALYCLAMHCFQVVRPLPPPHELQ